MGVYDYYIHSKKSSNVYIIWYVKIENNCMFLLIGITNNNKIMITIARKNKCSLCSSTVHNKRRCPVVNIPSPISIPPPVISVPIESNISPDKIDNVDSLEETKFIQIIGETYAKYFTYGARSSQKVDYFHSEIKKLLESCFTEEKGYTVKLEYNIEACNASKKKKCDIVILKNKIPYTIFPVKVIMTNYKQNKNNSWENLTGELTHIKWCNPNLHIVPINILMNKTPYLKDDKKIRKFENVDINDIQTYDELKSHNICYDVINYIVEVEHSRKEGEYFDEIKEIKGLSIKYRPLSSILHSIL